MPVLVSVADLRDWVVVIYGIIGIICFFVTIVVMVVIGFSVKGLIRSVRGLLDDSVKPTLTSIRDAADTVRGTTEFMGDTAVRPIVKAYGAFAGIKKGLGMLRSLGRGKRGK